MMLRFVDKQAFCTQPIRMALALAMSLGLALLAGCGGDFDVNKLAFSCDPGADDPCGSGYSCRSVPGQDYSACYALGDEPTDTQSGDTSDAGSDSGPSDSGPSDAADTADADPDDADDGVTCQSGQMECEGRCVDVLTSVIHCGACNNTCEAVANADAVCNDGECRYQCLPEQVDLDGRLENGCECQQDVVDEVDACDNKDNDCDGVVDEGCP
jgi:hypothetical protein